MADCLGSVKYGLQIKSAKQRKEIAPAERGFEAEGMVVERASPQKELLLNIWVVPKKQGPIWIPLNIGCRNAINNQKRPIILRITNIL